MADKDKPKTLVEKTEEDMIQRRIMAWLNNYCPYVPNDLVDGIVLYEQLKEEAPCMALSTIPATYIIEENIIGGYEALYQFNLIYRVKPARPSDRLVADEVLNQIGSWARAEKPDLGEYIQPLEIEFATRAYYVDAYEGGEEDHMIALSLRYKVNPF